VTSVIRQFVALVKEPLVDFAPLETCQGHSLLADHTVDRSLELSEQFLESADLGVRLTLSFFCRTASSLVICRLNYIL
jgi:hypothetical protein